MRDLQSLRAVRAIDAINPQVSPLLGVGGGEVVGGEMRDRSGISANVDPPY